VGAAPTSATIYGLFVYKSGRLLLKHQRRERYPHRLPFDWNYPDALGRGSRKLKGMRKRVGSWLTRAKLRYTKALPEIVSSGSALQGSIFK